MGCGKKAAYEEEMEEDRAKEEIKHELQMLKLEMKSGKSLVRLVDKIEANLKVLSDKSICLTREQFEAIDGIKSALDNFKNE